MRALRRLTHPARLFPNAPTAPHWASTPRCVAANARDRAPFHAIPAPLPPVKAGPVQACRRVSTHFGRDAPVARFRVALKALDHSPLKESELADAAWEAYNELGSARGLSPFDIDTFGYFLASHAVEEQARSREVLGAALLDPGAKALADKACTRMLRVFEDCIAARVTVANTAGTRFVQLNDYRLHTVPQVMNFLSLSKGGVPISIKTLTALVRRVATEGNYTATLRLLHECSQEAKLSRSEDLPGYARTAGWVADLAVPHWGELRFDPGSRAAIPDDDNALLDIERADDPTGALRDALAASEPPRFAELYRPGLAPGSVSPARKIVQILRFASAPRRCEEALNNFVVGTAIEAATTWRHHRLAHAALDCFSAEPFSIRPTSVMLDGLLSDAMYRRDFEAGDRLVERMEREGMERSPNHSATIARYYRTAGRIDLAEKVEREVADFLQTRRAATAAALREEGFGRWCGRKGTQGRREPEQDGRRGRAR
ncbi:hypothetical protein DFJ74DRAFT_772608 [Hyaloraphidium curvatum]|nr:hypothetical protein DFJ74DRAFT_772608 [Hyaloraphidium curvatum]